MPARERNECSLQLTGEACLSVGIVRRRLLMKTNYHPRADPGAAITSDNGDNLGQYKDINTK